MSKAQQDDPVCRKVLSCFGGDLTLARPPTLRPEEMEGDVKWFGNRFNKLMLLQFNTGTTLLTILAETRQEENAEITKKFKSQVIVPVSQRTAAMSAAHTKAHWGITKTAETIAKDFVWEKNEGRRQKIRTPMRSMSGKARGKLERRGTRTQDFP